MRGAGRDRPARARSVAKLVERPEPLPGRRADRRHLDRAAVAAPSARSRCPTRPRTSWSAHGWGDGLAGATGVVGVTLIISFVTLVLGELAPKRLGAAARREAPRCSSRRRWTGSPAFFRPVIWLLSQSTNVRRPAARRRPERRPRADQRGGAARPGRRARVADHRRAPADRRRLRRRRALDRRGDGAAHRGGFLDAAMTVSRAAKRRRRVAALALPGRRPRPRRRARLRPHPRPARAGDRARPRPHGRRPGPRGQGAARHQAGARRAVGDAPRGPPPGDRRRRVRRHRRHRHPRGPGRGGHRRHPRRVRRADATSRAGWPAARSRSTACSTWTTSPRSPASSCPRARTRRSPAS